MSVFNQFKNLIDFDGLVFKAFGLDDFNTVIVEKIGGVKRPTKADASWRIPALPLHVQNLSKLKLTWTPKAAEQGRYLIAEAAERVRLSKATTSELDFSGFNLELHPYQKAGVEYMLRAKRILLADEMGLGKTAQALALLYKEPHAYPALIVCPASLKYWWKQEGERCLPNKLFVVLDSKFKPLSIAMADVCIVNYDLLAAGWETPEKKDVKLTELGQALLAHPFETIIFDEMHACFPAGTMVTTNKGEIPIEEIVENKYQLDVLSYDLSKHVATIKPITGWVKVPLYNHLVKVKHSHGEFTATADHKIWTDAGWCEAGKLTIDMRIMWNSQAKQEAQQILQREMCGKMAHGSAITQSQTGRDSARNDGGLEQRTCITTSEQTHERTQSDVRPRNTPKSTSQIKSHRSCTQNERGQRSRHDGAASHADAGIDGLESRICAENKGLPAGLGQAAESLQNRYCAPGIQNSNRDRRSNTQVTYTQGAGLSQNDDIRMVRVDSVEILKQGSSDALFGGADCNFVYCLSVEGPENFFANGILVSNCKNHAAQRTKAVRKLAEGKTYRVGITGTPVTNRPAELAPILQILGRLADMGGWAHFMKRYCSSRANKFNPHAGSHHEIELNERMRSSFFLRRTKKDVKLELPPLTRSIIPIPIDNRKEYKFAEDQLIEWVREKAKERADRDEKLQKLLKNCRPEEREAIISEYADMKADRAMRAEAMIRIGALKDIAVRGKLKAAIQWIDDFLESGEKLVVFATHKHVLDKLIEHFPGAVCVTSDMGPEERQAAVNAFQSNPEITMLIGAFGTSAGSSPAGTGLTMTASSNVLFLELGWTKAHHDQAEARVYRMGQEQPCTAHYLTGVDTIEHDILALLDSKGQICALIQDGTEAEASVPLVDLLMEKLARLPVAA